jgi:hypothetical protein
MGYGIACGISFSTLSTRRKKENLRISLRITCYKLNILKLDKDRNENK